MVDDAVGLRSHRFLHVALRLRPVRCVEDFSAEEVLGEHARESVQAHHLGVPHSHDVQTASVPWVDLQALQRLAAYILRVLDARPRPLRERVFPKGTGEIEVAFGVPWICFDSAAGIELRFLEVRLTLVVIALVGTEIDGGARRFPERLIILGIELDCFLVVLQRSSSVHGDIFLVAERDVVGRSLGARNRRNEQHSCQAIL